MNADHTFQIGKEHTVCEDYALSGKISTNMAYAIVCDGCSASPDVDFGARVIALMARESILWSHLRESAQTFGKWTIEQAKEITTRLSQINGQCLDATLLIAYVEDKELTAFMFGDGVMVHKKKDKTNVTHIHLTSGAPDYLSYQLDAGRLHCYKNLKENQKFIQMGNLGDELTQIEGVPLIPHVLKTTVEEGDVISVISDGINSFSRSDDSSIKWTELVDEFTGFKNYEGQFVLRRINAFQRKCVKENLHHFDDISIASIVI